jgi:hypothetical protein
MTKKDLLEAIEDMPEVKSIYIRDSSYCLTSNSILIYPHRDYKTTIHFE